MAPIHPGTYRLVNVRDNTAITVPAYNTSTIVSWQTPNEPNQKWFVRRSESGNNYYIEDCMHCRYVGVDTPSVGARAYLERYPTEWEIVSVNENICLIKLPGRDLVLDSHGGENGAPIHIWPRNEVEPQKMWRFDWLSHLTGDEPELVHFETKTTNRVIAQVVEQIAQKDRQLNERDEQLTAQREQIANQAQEIQELKRRIEGKDQELEQMKEESPPQRQEPTTNGSTTPTSVHNNVAALQEKIDRLESLMMQRPQAKTMTSVEPGVYRIVNIGREVAITVSPDNVNKVVGWKAPNQPGQQWLVRRSKGRYHISDYIHGRYIGVDGARHCANTSLGWHPIFWELIPAQDTTWQIKLPEYSLVLDMTNNENSSPIYLWNQRAVPNDNKRWKFERLGGLPDEGPGPGRDETAGRDRVITQMAEQLAQQGKQLVELAGKLAEQNQRIADQAQCIADQSQHITEQNKLNTDQAGEILVLKRQIEEKDQQLIQTNREVGYMLARVAQWEEPLPQDRMARGDSLDARESLRGKVEHLESLVNQLMEKDNKMPNNMSRGE